MNVKHGIDVSDWNPDWSWADIKACGYVDFVMIQCTDGLNGVDDTAMEKMMGAKSVGLPFGFYHYFYPWLDPVIQVEHFYHYVIGLCGGFKGQVIPWLDCEESNGYGCEYISSQLLKGIQALTTKIGYINAAVYSGYDFAKDFFVGSIQSYKLVCAAYGQNLPDPQAPNFSLRPIPPGYISERVIGWQYTSKHLVPGINGAVDGTMLDFDNAIVS